MIEAVVRLVFGWRYWVFVCMMVALTIGLLLGLGLFEPYDCSGPSLFDPHEVAC